MLNKKTSSLMSLSLVLLLCLLSGQSAFPQSSSAYALETKSPERKLILDALRPPVEKVLKQKVIFKVDHLKVQGDWAFLRGVPRKATGEAMDYRGTQYQQAIKYGAFDDWICALLRKRGGEWQVIRYSIGATDVVYEGWDKEFKAPPAIFKE